MMSGSGIEESLSKIYAPNVVPISKQEMHTAEHKDVTFGLAYDYISCFSMTL